MIAFARYDGFGVGDGVGAGGGDIDPVGAVEGGDADDGLRPAAVRRAVVRTELVHAIQAVMRAYAAHPVKALRGQQKNQACVRAISLIEARPQRKFRSHEGFDCV